MQVPKLSEGDRIRQELVGAAKLKPELEEYVALSGRDRHRRAPHLFTSKGRLLQSLRPESESFIAATLQHADGHVDEHQSQLELLAACKTQPELQKYLAYSGRLRYQERPDLFSSKGRLLGAYRPVVQTPTPTPSIATNGRVRQAAEPCVDRESLMLQWRTADKLTDNDLLLMKTILTVKQRYAVAPEVFKADGDFRGQYARLPLQAVDPAIRAPSASIRGGQVLQGSETVALLRNTAFNGPAIVDGTRLSCSAWQSPATPSCLIIAFTRTSDTNELSYGKVGMFRRAQRAAESFAALYNERSPLSFAIPRQGISSRAILFDAHSIPIGSGKQSLMELYYILNAAQAGRAVYLLSVGFDRFSTEPSNYVKIAKTWPHLKITVVIMVHADFAGSEDTFQTASNGIRYAIMPIQALRLCIEGTLATPRICEFLDICKVVNEARANYADDESNSRRDLLRYTNSRANFRVHPDTESENGVEPGLTEDQLVKELRRCRQGYSMSAS